MLYQQNKKEIASSEGTVRKETGLTLDQELAALLGASGESVRRWKVSVPSNGTLTAELVAEAKDSAGALRGWWPRGEMPAQFRNMKPWKTKEELAEVRKVLASEIGVHVNTLRVLWRKREIPPLPPDEFPSLDYLVTLENHPIIRACKLTTTKKELAARVGESVPTLHHLWRHGAIPELPHDGKLTTEYVADIRGCVRRWRVEMREQKKLTAERKTKAATWNREATQKNKLHECLKVAGLGTGIGTVRRWLRKGEIPELPKDGGLPAEYVKAVIVYARRAKERHRENTRRGQNLPGVRERKRESQRRAALRPEEKARKSAVAREMWAKRKAKLGGRPATKASILVEARKLKQQGIKPSEIARRLTPYEYETLGPKRAAKLLRDGMRYYETR